MINHLYLFCFLCSMSLVIVIHKQLLFLSFLFRLVLTLGSQQIGIRSSFGSHFAFMISFDKNMGITSNIENFNQNKNSNV